MNKKTIWKSFYLFNSQEEAEFLEFLKEEYPDMDNEELMDMAYRINDEYFDDDFGEHGNLSYSSLKNIPCVVSGVLGLWDGQHKIIPTEFKTIQQAIYSCLEESNEIYEDKYGNLCIDAHHHDGTNHFVLKIKTEKGLRCIRYTKII